MKSQTFLETKLELQQEKIAKLEQKLQEQEEKLEN